MLDLKQLRENPQDFQEKLKSKNFDLDIALILEKDGERRQLIGEVESLKAKRNSKSADISKNKKAGADVTQDILDNRTLGHSIKLLQDKLNNLDHQIKKYLLTVPNTPHSSVPIGANKSENVIVRTAGETPQFDFEPKNHLVLGEALGLFDFKRGAKISGRGFPVFTGPGAKLERALINYFLDFHTNQNGFTEIIPPLLVNRQTMTSTGQLPKMEEDMYLTRKDGLFLIPTAEVPVTGLHAQEMLAAGRLPVSYVAYTPCFRREAGSWGKDTRGFQRLHQFNQVEMVKFVEPQTSYYVLEELVSFVEQLLQSLGLKYRVLSLCSGDLSFAAAKSYNIEVFAPAAKTWLEASSVSNYEDFQARRANIRYKNHHKPRFVHTLNGSGLATPRVLVALLETHQTSFGSIKIPAVLQAYMGNLSQLSA